MGFRFYPEKEVLRLGPPKNQGTTLRQSRAGTFETADPQATEGGTRISDLGGYLR